MAATGVKWFSMAFMLSGGGCNPAWDSLRPLHGSVDEQIINGIRADGGDVVVSFGGFSGNKLGPNCPDATSLAGAYQQVIDAYQLKAVDFDVENSDEFGNTTVRQRILSAVKLLKQHNPSLTAILTFGTGTGGPGSLIIGEAKSLGANVDIFTIMPFDFGGSDMFADTVSASEGLRSQLMATFGWSADTAYRHMGISSMNGMTDAGETVTQSTFTQIRDWAANHHLARLSFWAVNRRAPAAASGTATASRIHRPINFRMPPHTRGRSRVHVGPVPSVWCSRVFGWTGWTSARWCCGSGTAVPARRSCCCTAIPVPTRPGTRWRPDWPRLGCARRCAGGDRYRPWSGGSRRSPGPVYCGRSTRSAGGRERTSRRRSATAGCTRGSATR